MAATLDFNESVANNPAAALALLSIESVDIAVIAKGRPFLVPLVKPEPSQSWNLEFMVKSDFAIFVVEADLLAQGGVYWLD